MPRLCTRIKRQYYVTRSRHGMKNTAKVNGAKTFSTKEHAEAHAKEQGIKEFSIESAKKGKRFKITQ